MLVIFKYFCRHVKVAACNYAQLYASIIIMTLFIKFSKNFPIVT